MYAEPRVRERLHLAEDELRMPLAYHSVSQVEEFESRLREGNKYTYNEIGKPNGTLNLTAEESQWMMNEQALCTCDFVYFVTRYGYLRDEEGIIKRFQFRIPQRIYFDIVCDLEMREVAIELLALKARQLGISIFSELLISHRSMFNYGANAIIGSADQTKTSEMTRMMFLCYDMLPVWLRPSHTSRVESDRGKLLFGGTASGITFQHGSQKFGIGTGTTPTLYHLSEVALYGDEAQEKIDEGLWKAVHASDRVFGVLESTGRGDKGWWADTWRFSKKNWPRCRMYPMFLPWFCGVDIYPKPAWLKLRPIPSDWRPKRDTRQHVAKSELYVRSTPLLNKHLVEQQRRAGTLAPDGLWRMPREQQYFWEVTYEEAKATGFTSSFLQEMAGDDIEALQHSEESVFGHETIAEIDTRRTRTYHCYGLSGQSIEDAHEPPPEDIDYRRERIPVRYSSPKGEVYRWELIPLAFRHELDESNPEEAIGKFIVFHPPTPGKSYSIGVDTSEGKGEDSTVISVWECGSKGSPDIQCAEFASPYVSHVEAFSFVLCIAAYYGQYMESGVTRWKQPYVAIEQVAAVGDTCQLQMRKMGYSNFHRMTRYDGKRVSKSRAVKLGWYTFSWSRPLLTGNFVHAAQNGWAEINSPWLLDEMKHFEVHVTSTGKEKLEHEEGEHDDRIFAAAMAIFCPHDMDVLADRSKKRTVEEAGLPRLDTRPYGGQVITAAQMRQPLETLEDIVYSEPLRRH
jgi:hypothetical protein